MDRNKTQVGILALLLILFGAFLFSSISALRLEEGARHAGDAAECYRALSQLDSCLCLTRVAALDNRFDEHADQACKEVR